MPRSARERVSQNSLYVLARVRAFSIHLVIKKAKTEEQEGKKDAARYICRIFLLVSCTVAAEMVGNLGS